jgi:hypothetical protein
VRLRGQLSGSGGRGYPASVVPRRETTPTSPQGAVNGPSPITVDRWVPRLHPFVVSPAYWMELGAIGREERHRLLGELPETLAVSVERVTFLRSSAFPSRLSAKTPGTLGVCAGHYGRNRAVSESLSFRYVTYFTFSSASKRW